MKNTVNNIFTQAMNYISAGIVILTLAYSASTVAADFPEAGNFSEGSKVWAENCNRCHNMRDPKELRDDQWISVAFHMRVRAGLTGQEMRDVLTFLQASNTKSVAASTTQVIAVTRKSTTGEETFKNSCAACHGDDGKGAFPGTPNFTDSNGALSKSDDVLIGHITNGFQSPGSPMAMPPKGGNPNLDESAIKAVLTYIRVTFGK